MAKKDLIKKVKKLLKKARKFEPEKRIKKWAKKKIRIKKITKAVKKWKKKKTKFKLEEAYKPRISKKKIGKALRKQIKELKILKKHPEKVTPKSILEVHDVFFS